ncbi:hypothetical protein BY996DRAFT_6408251 [Phakopsora pachyrhizi]|nr:hypothetical protein BY996DRAFT_6408251 [Phakopsora pachyrhizi]
MLQGYPGLLLSEANNLSFSAPSGALISALSNVSTLHTSHCHHGPAKSATLVLEDHSKGPEALQHFVKDDWDMPSVGIFQDLTWKQLEKKLTKSFRLEIPDFGSLNLKQSEKETHSPTPKPNPHPCAIDYKLKELSNNKKSHRSALRHTPSANGALVGSEISSSFLINGKKPSKPDQQSAHAFSVPSSPSPDCVDSSQITITAGKQSLNLKNSRFGEDVGAIKPSSLSNASEDKSTMLGKFSPSALCLGSSQSGNLVQADQLA